MQKMVSPKEKTIKKKPISIVRILFIISFILIPTVHFLVTYVYVNIDSFVMAFKTIKNGQTIWSFENFTTFYSESGSQKLNGFQTNPLTVKGRGCIINMYVKSVVHTKYSVKIIKFNFLKI